jgi:hypothetical protein
MAPLLRSRSVQLTALAALLLLAGPVMQLLHERRGGHVTPRGRLRDPQKLGMGAFLGDTPQHAHAVSAVQAWQEQEAKRLAAGRAEVTRQAGQSADAAAALQAAMSAHAELDRLHMQQREMIELHLAAGQHGDDAALAAEAEAELWAKAEIEDYVAHHRKQKQPSESGGEGAAAAGGAGGGGEGASSGAAAHRLRRLFAA